MNNKDLIEAFQITEVEASYIMSLIEGLIDPEDSEYYDEVTKGYHNPPKRYHAILLIADKICETCGIEYVARPGERFYDSEGVSYLNTGDTYAGTLGYNHQTHQFELGCWGDWYEELKEDGFDEEWDSWISSEFESQLKRKFNLEDIEIESDDDKDWLKELFNYACSRVSNDDTWWTESDGRSIYVNWKPIINSLSLSDLDRHFVSYELEEE